MPFLPSAPGSQPFLSLLDGLRVIGQSMNTFIIAETSHGLVVIDQHVAHERVLYDRLDQGVTSGGIRSQRLLTPILYEAALPDVAVLESHLAELQGAGFEIERFSGNSFAIAAVPTGFERTNLTKFFQKLIEASVEEKTSHWSRLRHRVLSSLACQAAIKVHRSMTGEEMSRLVADLLQSTNPYACPHGRPIIVDIRHIDIEKHFHRR